MKILLIGEASGVQKNLKKGLVQLGHEVEHVILNSRGSQNRESDGSFSPELNGVVGGVSRNIAPFYKISRLKKYDVINFGNTITAVHGRYTKYLDLPLLRTKATVFSYFALGCDEIGLIRRSIHDFPYSPCNTCLSSGEVLGKDCQKRFNPDYEASIKRVKKYFDFGASSMIEYDHSSQCFDRFQRIPLPIDIDAISFQPIKNKNKLNIVHAPTRKGFKGTAIVEGAIKILSTQRNDFDYKIIHGLSYEDYKIAMNDADIVIDQVYSQSPGMGALEMLAAGKVVLTGATEIGKSYFDFMSNFPGINAEPNPEVLARTLHSALDNIDKYVSEAETYRQYVAENHSCVSVAKQFLTQWSELL